MLRAFVLFACLLSPTTGLISVQKGIDSRKGNDLKDADEATPSATENLAAAGWRRRWCPYCEGKWKEAKKATERAGKAAVERSDKAAELSWKATKRTAERGWKATERTGKASVRATERGYKATERGKKQAVEWTTKQAVELGKKALEVGGKIATKAWEPIEERRKSLAESNDKDNEDRHSHFNETSGCDGEAKNLVTFLDGSGCYPDRYWTRYYPLGKFMNVHLVKLWRSAEVSCSQWTHYQSGIGTDSGDTYKMGTGIKERGDIAFQWYQENHNDGDQIFVFGYSRGTLSSRYLQGRIGQELGGARVDFLGLFEAVLRTIGFWRWLSWAMPLFKYAKCLVAAGNDCAPTGVTLLGILGTIFWTLPGDGGMSNLNLEVDGATGKLRHAIALDEPKMSFESNELLVVGGYTNNVQVWFPGTHLDLGGVQGETCDANYVWMVDEAMEAGLLMESSWADGRAVEVSADVNTEQGLESGSFGKFMEIRNPAKCREQAGRGLHSVKLHQIVADRADAISGWVPSTYCCANFKNDLGHFGTSYVTSDTYDSIKTANGANQWVRVSIGQLSGAAAGGYVAHVDTWHEMSIEYAANAGGEMTDESFVGGVIGQQGYYGCCQPRQLSLNGRTTIPYESDVGQGVLIQIKAGETYVGHRVVLYDDDTSTTHALEDSDATLEASLEFLTSDSAAEDDLPSTHHSGEAQCRWLFSRIHKEASFPSPKLGDGGSGDGNLCAEGFDDISFFTTEGNYAAEGIASYVMSAVWRHLLSMNAAADCDGHIGDATYAFHAIDYATEFNLMAGMVFTYWPDLLTVDGGIQGFWRTILAASGLSSGLGMDFTLPGLSLPGGMDFTL